MNVAAPRIYSPATLAREWGCSERHIRNLVAAGELRAFRLGQKLLRIPRDAVEDFECRNIASDGSEADTSLRSPEGESATASLSELQTRARLSVVRRRISPT